MLDPQLLRRDLETVKRGLDARGATFDEARYQTLESRRREVIQQAELLKAARNKAAEEVGKLAQQIKGAELLKKQIGAGAAGALIRDAEIKRSDLINQQREDGNRLKDLEQAEREADAAFRDFVATIPNLPDASVPVGADEHGNLEIKCWGQHPVIANPLDHVELGTRLGILDLDRAAKLSGARFSVLMGWGAKLERALAAFMLDRQSANGYLEVIPPYLVNAESLYGTGQLPKFEADLFKMPHGESSLYLIPTAEVPVTNLYRDEVLAFDQLPLRHCSLTPCFRSEAGSHGRDTKGLIRQHQFHKVELVSFAAPEQAEAELERLTGNAEAILEELELPYRRVLLCTGDMGFSSRKTYDLEVWLPSQDTYREISSCSWFGDFQARRANIKYKPADVKAKAAFLHTLNGSGLAVGRTWVAVLENGQQADGSVKIPTALVPYLGTDRIH